VTWEPINLAKLEPRPKIAPSIGGVNLIYPGKRHVFSGPPESAKTLAGYAVALEEVRLGGNVLLIDFEMGQWDARDRLREMGATDEELEHIFYIEPETPATEEIVETLAGRWTFTLVIIDAAAGAYSLQALDDNLRKDVEKFTRIYVRSFWLRGVATIVVDHVAKNAGTRGAFAIGSERKVGGVDVHLGFEVAVAIKRGGRGLYKVVTHKDRLGHLERPKAAELELRSDALTHALTWTFTNPEPSSEAGSWQPTHLMEKVSRWLEKQADEVSRNDVDKAKLGTAVYVRQALDELIRDEYVQETAGARRSRLVRSLKPYRESTSSDFVGSSSRRSEQPSSDDFVASSTPLGGDDVDEVAVFDECTICEHPYDQSADGSESMTCPACVALRRGLVTPSEAGEMRLLTRLSLMESES